MTKTKEKRLLKGLGKKNKINSNETSFWAAKEEL